MTVNPNVSLVDNDLRRECVDPAIRNRSTQSKFLNIETLPPVNTEVSKQDPHTFMTVEGFAPEPASTLVVILKLTHRSPRSHASVADDEGLAHSAIQQCETRTDVATSPAFSDKNLNPVRLSRPSCRSIVPSAEGIPGVAGDECLAHSAIQQCETRTDVSTSPAISDKNSNPVRLSRPSCRSIVPSAEGIPGVAGDECLAHSEHTSRVVHNREFLQTMMSVMSDRLPQRPPTPPTPPNLSLRSVDPSVASEMIQMQGIDSEVASVGVRDFATMDMLHQLSNPLSDAHPTLRLMDYLAPLQRQRIADAVENYLQLDTTSILSPWGHVGTVLKVGDDLRPRPGDRMFNIQVPSAANLLTGAGIAKAMTTCC